MDLNIAFTINNEYAQHCGVTIRSIVLNNPKSQFQFHIISSDQLSDINKIRLRKMIGKGNSLELYQGVSFEKINFKVDGHASVENYYRIFLANILPPSMDRVLYLDCDLLVLGDLINLWDLDLSPNAAAVVHQPNLKRSEALGLNPEQYFNTGVMMMNLEYIRKYNVVDECIRFMTEKPHLIKYWDQDVLNYVLKNKVLLIDRKFNNEVDKSHTVNPAIIHFTGKHKPWHIYYQNKMKLLYFKYLYQTPWFWRFTKNHVWLLMISIFRRNNLATLRVLFDDVRKKGWPKGI